MLGLAGHPYLPPLALWPFGQPRTFPKFRIFFVVVPPLVLTSFLLSCLMTWIPKGSLHNFDISWLTVHQPLLLW